MTSQNLDLSLIRRFKRRAERALPDRIAHIVLFGSRARREATHRSDWDVAVILKGRASSKDTLELADAAYDLIVETGETIHPIALSEDGQGASPLLLDHIAIEGIRV